MFYAIYVQQNLLQTIADDNSVEPGYSNAVVFASNPHELVKKLDDALGIYDIKKSELNKLEELAKSMKLKSINDMVSTMVGSLSCTMFVRRNKRDLKYVYGVHNTHHIEAFSNRKNLKRSLRYTFRNTSVKDMDAALNVVDEYGTRTFLFEDDFVTIAENR